MPGVMSRIFLTFLTFLTQIPSPVNTETTVPEDIPPMTTQTRIQLKLQPDSGSIFYQDREDGVVFHIEAMRDSSSSSSSSSPTTSPHHSSSNNHEGCMDVRTGGHSKRRTSKTDGEGGDQSDMNCGEDGEEQEEEEGKAATATATTITAQTDLIKSFLRQHLVKNGEDSRCLIPMMNKDSVEALLIATVGLHLRKDGGGAQTFCDAGVAVRTLHRTLGTLVSMLQQREKVLRFVEENIRGGCDEDRVGE